MGRVMGGVDLEEIDIGIGTFSEFITFEDWVAEVDGGGEFCDNDAGAWTGAGAGAGAGAGTGAVART